jgi:hypothetical protein
VAHLLVQPNYGDNRIHDQKQCATIMARVDISLPSAHMKGKNRTMIRKRSLTRVTRKKRNSQRRNLTDKFKSVKNGTQLMRVLSRIVMIWQP